jgi:hypothetical protein
MVESLKRKGATMRKSIGFLAVALMIAVPLVAQAKDNDKGMAECTMTFNLKGWSVFFEEATGTGVVTCNNGQKADVRLRVQGGGLSFGKYDVINGKGTFSDVTSIKEIYGGYVAGTAEAGAVKSASASVYTKGTVSLALAGTGRGVEIGFDFGKLEIKPLHEKMR